MTTLIILPHQLFDFKYFPKEENIEEIILYEHPQYFTKYKYNKKRLVMHRASMKAYFDELKSNKTLKNKVKNFKYLEYKDSTKSLPKEAIIFDPIDKLKLPSGWKMIESPNFLLTKEQYQKYRDTKSKKFFFNSFYMWGKKEIDLIPNLKSQDSANRKKMPVGTKIPKLPSNVSKSEEKYIKEAIEYVEKEFPKNYGTSDDFVFPITRRGAKAWLKDFIKKRFKDFGSYQDYIRKDETFMFHSCLSTVINIGLLNPSQIVDEIRGLDKKIPTNSYEGYVRQLFWREYQRFCYIHFDFKGLNYFGNKKKLTKDWYQGTTGIDPVDDAIKTAFDTGYLHHILRLMVIGNYMNLSGIAPKEGFKWFMEFSCDSYEWVMEQNVLDMVFCVSGGQTMRKPYISSSNYVIQMSDYKKGEWSETWNKQYRAFLNQNKSKLLPRFAYAFGRLF